MKLINLRKNQHVFTISRPSDRYHVNFDSTPINGSSASVAKEILSRTYKPELGFILTERLDLFSIQNKKELEIGLDFSLNSASL